MSRSIFQRHCPSCGSCAEIQDRSEVRCAFCNTVTQSFGLHASTGSGYTPLNNHAIRIGMKAQIRGREYVAVAQILYRQQDEDASVSRWEEWVLVSRDNHVFYLEFDGAKQTITEAWKEPLGVPGGAAMIRFPDGQMAMRFDQGVCQIEKVNGIVPWDARPTNSLTYHDYSRGNTIYSYEIESDGGTGWYIGHRTDWLQIYTWFGLHKERAAAEKALHVRTDRRRFGGLLSLLACLCLCGGCAVSNVKGTLVAGGNGIAQEIGDVGKPFGKYPWQSVTRPYRLKLWTDNMSSSSLAAMAVIEDKDGAAFSDQQEFWDESGYDDGPWHEWSLTSYTNFRLAQPGEYTIRLYADPEPTTAMNRVAFEVEQGVWDATPLYWFGGVGLVLGILWMCAGAPEGTWQRS